MKAVVMGSGGWGTALAMVLCDNGHETTLWSHNAAKAAAMEKSRENPLLKGIRLPDSLRITGDLSCLEGADLVVSAPPSFAVRETGRKMAPYLRPETVLVTVSKGSVSLSLTLRLPQDSSVSLVNLIFFALSITSCLKYDMADTSFLTVF